MKRINRTISILLAFLLLISIPVLASDEALAENPEEEQIDALIEEAEEAPDKDVAPPPELKEEPVPEPDEPADSELEVAEPEDEEAIPSLEKDAESRGEVEVVFLPETLSEMEAALPSYLTGDWSEDLLSIARSQLGYEAREDGYSRYADWCSQYASDWCYECEAEWNRGELWASWRDSWENDAYAQWDACFVSFCLYYSGVPIEQMPPAPTAEYWVKLLDAAGMPIMAKDYKPVPGDLVFFDWDETNNTTVYNEDGDVEEIVLVADRVAVVASVLDEGRFSYIMGDFNHAVQEQQAWLDDVTIIGYAALPEEPKPEEIAVEEEIADPIDGTAEEQPEEQQPEEIADDDGAEEDVAPQLENDVEDENTTEAAGETDNGQADESEEAEAVPALNGMAESLPTVIADTYAFAPSGYVLLRINNDLATDQSYVFNGMPLYYTENPAYLVNIMDESAFVMLIPAEFVENGSLTEAGAELLTVADGEREELTFSSDVNEDGVVNIADANAIYQMIQNGGDYYTVEQVGLEARLRLQYENIGTLDSVMDEING